MRVSLSILVVASLCGCDQTRRTTPATEPTAAPAVNPAPTDEKSAAGAPAGPSIDVAAEVAWLLERYAPERLWFADDVFTISPRWLAAYRRLAVGGRLVRPFECITRADRVTAAVAEDLAALGCWRVWLGSESGSQRILDAMERGVTVAQVQEATRLLQAAGIQVGMFLMWGYDGETEADIAATIQHVKDTGPDVFLTTVAYPIRGTPYFDAVAPAVVAPDPFALERNLPVPVIVTPPWASSSRVPVLRRPEPSMSLLTMMSPLEIKLMSAPSPATAEECRPSSLPSIVIGPAVSDKAPPFGTLTVWSITSSRGLKSRTHEATVISSTSSAPIV